MVAVALSAVMVVALVLAAALVGLAVLAVRVKWDVVGVTAALVMAVGAAVASVMVAVGSMG